MAIVIHEISSSTAVQNMFLRPGNARRTFTLLRRYRPPRVDLWRCRHDPRIDSILDAEKDHRRVFSLVEDNLIRPRGQAPNRKRQALLFPLKVEYKDIGIGNSRFAERRSGKNKSPGCERKFSAARASPICD